MGKPSAPAPPDYTPIAMASQNQLQMSDEQVKAQEQEAQQQFGLASSAYANQDKQAQQAIDLANQEFGASKAAQDKQYGLQSDALDWAKQTYNDNKNQNQQIIDSEVAAQRASQDAATRAQQRYETVYQPLEDQSVQEAMNYASPDRKQQMMGAAAGSVAQATEQARLSAQSNLESFGIDPSSTRYAAMDAGIRINGAAAAAGAGTQAGLQADATQRALEANAINVGRGLPSDVNAGYNTSVNAGNAASGAALNTTASGASTMGTAVQYGTLANGLYGAGIGAINAGSGASTAPNGALALGTGAIGAGNGALGAANSAIGTWGNTLNQGFSNSMSAYNANMNASSGFGSLLGTAAGFIPGLADGGTVPGGAAVPVHASPTGGRAIDDVPARLTPGEFVVPKDVVQWKGEEFFQKLATKSRQDRQTSSPAQPRMMAVPVQRPTFSSPSAIPAR